MSVDTKLQTSRCYQINGYACTTTERSNRVIPNPVSIRMGAATKIMAISDISSIPSHYFSFGDFDDIQDMSLGADRITDYIGVLESIEDGRTKRNSRAFVNLKINDASHETVYITLWEEIFSRFDRFPRITIEKAEKPCVLAVTSLRFNKYSGRLDLQSTATTHVYLNPDHPIAEELLDKYDPQILLENKQLSLIASNAERITVSELLVKEHPIPPNLSLKKDGTILAAQNAKVQRIRVAIIGSALTAGIQDITYKSRIVVMISDGQSQLKIAMFDDTLSTLLAKPLHDIISEDGYDDNSFLPEPILRIRGERRLFVLKPQLEQYTNTLKFIVKEILALDYFAQPLAIEGPNVETPPPITPVSTQLEASSNTPQPTSPPPTTPTSTLMHNTFTTPDTTSPPRTTPMSTHKATPSTQIDGAPSDTEFAAKRKLEFTSKETPSPISDTKHIGYKE